MTDSKEDNPLSVEVVQDHVGTVPEFDDPFPKFRKHLFDRAANLGVGAEGLHASADRGDGSACGVGTAGR